MSTADSWTALAATIRDAKLEHVLGDAPFVQGRIDGLMREVAQRMANAPRSAHVAAPTADVIAREFQRNPQRVLPLLQAIAFNCSPTMLAMLWLVQMGGRIQSIDYHFDRAAASRLEISVELRDRETVLAFESSEHWDLAVLRMAGLSKGDGHALIDGFFGV